MSCYVLLAGLPGTGKSTLASALSSALDEAAGLNAVVLNKDTIRAALFPGRAADYSPAQNDLAMAALLSAAAHLSHQQQGPRFLFIDGRTFSRAAHIDQVVRAAESSGATWRILHLLAPDDVALARIAAARDHPAADRSAALYWKLKHAFEPILQPHLVINTSRDLATCREQALTYLLH